MTMIDDPWSSLVHALAGQRRTQPEDWPRRKVHRMLDDLPVELLRQQRRPNPPPRAAGPR